MTRRLSTYGLNAYAYIHSSRGMAFYHYLYHRNDAS